MYPDLSYLLNALLGTPVDNVFSIVKTFGFFLVLAIMGAAYLLYLELVRKEKEGLLQPKIETITIGEKLKPYELLSNIILGFILGFKLVYIFQNFAEFKFDPAGVVLSGLGSWLGGIIGALVLGGVKYYDKKKQELPSPETKNISIAPHDRISDITMLAAISGVIGAKIFAVFEDLGALASGQITITDFTSQLLSGGGLAIYGGLILGFVVVYIYLKRKDIPPIHVMDAVAPALMFGYGIGRLGCHFSGDGDWGIPSNLSERPDWLAWLPDWLWSFDYPHNVIGSDQVDLQGNRVEPLTIEDCGGLRTADGTTPRYCTKLGLPVYPTPVYEAVMAFLITGILWILRKRISVPGLLFFIYLVFNGFERFWIEKIRVNDRSEILGFNTTQAELIAVLLLITGLVGGVWLWVRQQKAAK